MNIEQLFLEGYYLGVDKAMKKFRLLREAKQAARTQGKGNNKTAQQDKDEKLQKLLGGISLNPDDFNNDIDEVNLINNDEGMFFNVQKWINNALNFNKKYGDLINDKTVFPFDTDINSFTPVKSIKQYYDDYVEESRNAHEAIEDKNEAKFLKVNKGLKYDRQKFKPITFDAWKKTYLVDDNLITDDTGEEDLYKRTYTIYRKIYKDFYIGSPDEICEILMQLYNRYCTSKAEEKNKEGSTTNRLSKEFIKRYLLSSTYLTLKHMLNKNGKPVFDNKKVTDKDLNQNGTCVLQKNIVSNLLKNSGAFISTVKKQMMKNQYNDNDNDNDKSKSLGERIDGALKVIELYKIENIKSEAYKVKNDYDGLMKGKEDGSNQDDKYKGELTSLTNRATNLFKAVDTYLDHVGSRIGENGIAPLIPYLTDSQKLQFISELKSMCDQSRYTSKTSNELFNTIIEKAYREYLHYQYTKLADVDNALNDWIKNEKHKFIKDLSSNDNFIEKYPKEFIDGILRQYELLGGGFAQNKTSPIYTTAVQCLTGQNDTRSSVRLTEKMMKTILMGQSAIINDSRYSEGKLFHTMSLAGSRSRSNVNDEDRKGKNQSQQQGRASGFSKVILKANKDNPLLKEPITFDQFIATNGGVINQKWFVQNKKNGEELGSKLYDLGERIISDVERRQGRTVTDKTPRPQEVNRLQYRPTKSTIKSDQRLYNLYTATEKLRGASEVNIENGDYKMILVDTKQIQELTATLKSWVIKSASKSLGPASKSCVLIPTWGVRSLSKNVKKKDGDNKDYAVVILPSSYNILMINDWNGLNNKTKFDTISVVDFENGQKIAISGSVNNMTKSDNTIRDKQVEGEVIQLGESGCDFFGDLIVNLYFSLNEKNIDPVESLDIIKKFTDIIGNSKEDNIAMTRTVANLARDKYELQNEAKNKVFNETIKETIKKINNLYHEHYQTRIIDSLKSKFLNERESIYKDYLNGYVSALVKKSNYYIEDHETDKYNFLMFNTKRLKNTIKTSVISDISIKLNKIANELKIDNATRDKMTKDRLFSFCYDETLFKIKRDLININYNTCAIQKGNNFKDSVEFGYDIDPSIIEDGYKGHQHDATANDTLIPNILQNTTPQELKEEAVNYLNELYKERLEAIKLECQVAFEKMKDIINKQKAEENTNKEEMKAAMRLRTNNDEQNQIQSQSQAQSQVQNQLQQVQQPTIS